MFAFLLSLVADYVCFVFCLGATPPPRAACEPASMRVPLACCLLSCVVVDLFLFFLLFLPSFDFDLDIVCFMLSFSCGHYAVSSVPLSAASRLAHDMYLIRTLISPFYFCLRFTICFSYCVLSSVFFLFSS